MRLRLFMSAVALIAASAAQGQQRDLNVISKVEVRDAGSSMVISIHGTKPPNFTTFSMMDPPRFVIDFSESRFRDTPEDMPVGNGLIKVIKNLSYGSDTNSIARVMIAFEKEVDPPDVQAAGETLLVKVAKPPGLPVASGAPADGSAQPKAREDAAAAAEAQARAEQEARAKSEAQARAAEEVRIKAEAEAQARTDAAADAKAKSEAEAQMRAEQEAKAKAESEAAAKAGAAAKAQAEAKTEEEARAKSEQEAQARAQAGTDGQAAGEQGAGPQAAAPAQEVAALPPAGPRTGGAAEPPAQRASRGPSDVQEVGFKMLPEVSRVFVRTSGLPEFTIQEAGENLIRLELANTRVKRRNDTRFLDTSFFPSAVAMVTPKRHGSSYVLEIKLKQRVAYQQKVEGDTLAIDFERPASMRSSAPPQPAGQPAAGDSSAAQPAPADATLPADQGQDQPEGESSPSPGSAGN